MITKKLIKSYIPEYFDTSHLKGVSLRKDAYSLNTLMKGKKYRLLTSNDNPLLKILSEVFEVKYQNHFYWHWSEFYITEK